MTFLMPGLDEHRAPAPADEPGAMTLVCPLCAGRSVRLTMLSAVSDPARGPRTGHMLWPRTGTGFTSDEAVIRADHRDGAIVFLDYQCATGCRGTIEFEIAPASTAIRLISDHA